MVKTSVVPHCLKNVTPNSTNGTQHTGHIAICFLPFSPDSALLLVHYNQPYRIITKITPSPRIHHSRTLYNRIFKEKILNRSTKGISICFKESFKKEGKKPKPAQSKLSEFILESRPSIIPQRKILEKRCLQFIIYSKYLFFEFINICFSTTIFCIFLAFTSVINIAIFIVCTGSELWFVTLYLQDKNNLSNNELTSNNHTRTNYAVKSTLYTKLEMKKRTERILKELQENTLHISIITKSTRNEQ